jgi:hypothetical protein
MRRISRRWSRRRRAFETGAARVSIDFTAGRPATREDPRNPWTGRGCCRISSSASRGGSEALEASAEPIGVRTVATVAGLRDPIAMEPLQPDTQHGTVDLLQ